MRRDPVPHGALSSRLLRNGRMLRAVMATGVFLLLPSVGCIDLGLGLTEQAEGVGGGTTLPGAFVIAGTMVEGESFRSCPVFEGESGIQFHVVRGDSVSSADFGTVITIGASSVLEVVLRRGLDVRCQVDDLREVLEVTAVLSVASP